MSRIHRRTIQKDLHDPDNHDGVITHLEPYILKCKVKWALGSTAARIASGGDGIPVEILKILKDNAMKVLHSICQQIWKTQQWPQDWKMSVFIPISKAMPKNVQTITQLQSSHTLVMLKILQARLQQYLNRELPDIQAGFRKARGTIDQITNIRWIMEKQQSSKKSSISSFLPMIESLTVWITINFEKLFKRWEYQTTLPAS